MTDTLLIFAALFAVSAAAPGADTMLMFGRALGGGARSAVPVAIGITAGKLVLLALAAAGVTAAAAALGPMFVVVKVVGAAYLVWLGLRLWRRRPEPVAQSAPVDSPSFGRGAAVGAGLALSNPQAILFYVAILPGVVTEELHALQYLSYAAALVVVMALVAAVYIGLGARARSAVVSPRGTRYADRAAGAMMVVAGGFVAAR
jgi:threonine/homoserine/homoserine lactone efflux protein